MYTLKTEQVLPVPVDRIWSFISRPENLNRITPDDLAFEINTKLPEEMYPGLLIQYRIKLPILGKRLWVTEIKHIVEGRSFVDEQRFGPYKFWYHYHEVEAQGDQTIMRDQVSYKLPFGIFGWIAHVLFVKRMLREIFSYREKAMIEIFGVRG